jgi:tetratricopeptide (TPR) repeat protein
MSPQGWERVKAVFHNALEQPQGARYEFVGTACADDEQVRREVLRLLEHHRGPDTFLEAPGAERLLGLEAGSAPGRVGPYTILGLLGEGGMGTVYRARRDDGLEVALKVLRADAVSPALIRRLEHEAEILSRLDHSGIARLYQAGWSEGALGRRPYLALELVDGTPILEYAPSADLDLRARVELMAQVCDAAGHAHAKGVIHRDLKPGNVLVVRGDGAAVAKVLDFGVARLLDSSARSATLMTLPGQLVGTPAYMSPEQAGGDPGVATTRSDVYALGLILYEILTERPALEVEGRSLTEIVRAVREVEPPAPGSIKPELRGSLEAVICRAIDKRPERRYAGASDLADELRRWLAGEPVLADAPSVLRHARAAVRRHRAAAIGFAAVSAALALGVVGTAWQASRAARQRDAAERAALDLLSAAARASQAADESLSNILGGTKARADMAERALRDAQAAAEKLPESHAAAHILGYTLQRVGEARLAQGRVEEALQLLHQSVAVRRAEAAAQPDDADQARALGVGLWTLAEGLRRAGFRREALSADQEAMTIQQRLADTGVYVQKVRVIYVGVGHRRVGEDWLMLKDGAKARLEFETALRELEDRREEDPEHSIRGRAIASARRGLGDAMFLQRDGAAALAAYDRALEECSRRARAEAPANLQWRTIEVETRVGRSRAMRMVGDGEGAREESRKAVGLARALAEGDPDSAELAGLAKRAEAEGG